MRFDCVHPQVREDKDRGIYVEGLTEHPVDAPDAVLALVHESATNRATCGTSMNRTSSRSHALLLLRVEQWTESTDEAAADLAAIQTGDETLSDRSSVVSASAPRIAVRRGLLSIVDLAGSERVCKSGSEGVRLEEAKRINKSIAALGNCIAALSTGNGKGTSHVPFRDSKLTRLLTDSLGGNTKTALCAAIGPALHNYDETFCTLLLATRARVVRNYARINERIERETNAAPERQALLAQMRALQTEVTKLRREKAEQRVPRALPPAPPPVAPPPVAPPATLPLGSWAVPEGYPPHYSPASARSVVPGG